ncbi:hypothetical protein F3Y22_tig00110223pilonHSYRG00235 [Hibiscus syriacus]|uniref:DUF7054 domain-containing protein n=1 Tax=Hibiscus syriacus TaxID=106335 RepID=A0A6A3BB43_HIBSY|nr:hypothetical protein F3Y22_tig00110223pilonHSYRG00235 [Hibiscus syriacus]
MIPRVPCSRRLSSMRVLSTSDRTLQTFPPEQNSDIIQRARRPCGSPGEVGNLPIYQRLTKLLVNVNIESSLGQCMSSDNTVKDLMKAAIEIYVKEKRRPLLEETDPNFFQLHYSQFSMEREKVINLGSRNFFLCWKQRPSPADTSSGKPKLASEPLFYLTKLVDLLL